MSAGEPATMRKARSSRKGRAGALQAVIAERIRDSLLPGDGPADPSWIEDAARTLLEAAHVRQPEETRIALSSASGDRRFLRIALINEDMPFLVDSVAAAIAEAGLVIDRLAHPVLPVSRDAEGILQALPEKEGERARRESMIYIETDRVDARQRRALLRSLEATLADVRSAVKDWPRMIAAMTSDADRVADAEGAELLRWFAGGMLTQLGHVTRRRDGTHVQLLGICRRGARDILSAASYDRAFEAFDRQLAEDDLRVPLVIKANRVSQVHRRVPMDLFLVPVVEDGRVSALSVHVGIWTSAALATPPHKVPRLRGLLGAMAEKLDLDPNGHTGKALVHAFTTLPHDLVLGLAENDVERLTTTMTGLVDRPRPRLLVTEAPLSRHLFAFVWLPRDMLSMRMHRRIQAMIEEAAAASTLDWSLQVEAGNLAMLRYTLDVRDGGVALDEQALDRQLQVMLRGWAGAVEAALAQSMDPVRAAAVAGRYADAFPMPYRTDYGPIEAATDIAYMRRLVVGEAAETTLHTGSRGARLSRLYRHARDGADQLRLKIYQAEGSLPLSDAVPALENFGFRVLGEVATQLAKGRMGTIHDFTVAVGTGHDAQDVLRIAPVIEDALSRVLNNDSENDAFNRLVPALGLSQAEVNWLRAWYRYLRQGGTHLGIITVVDALQCAPQVTLAILDLFRATHDPAFSGDRVAAQQEAAEAIRIGLAGVNAINHDRLLRAFRDLVAAMLRTNAFSAAGQLGLAFKFDSERVPGLPKPLPWREIFVYSRRVEGIHLRAGPIARGGLRWSDRRDDYRTEILGLLKAQRVKNAVIVPAGAKGGFYAKQLPDPALDRRAWIAEGQASYEIFIAALLSITDNIVNNEVTHPEGVVVLDGEDPYFVVAADKGTAKFSDVANGIAEAHDFWLDDAFASGGSNGYDHKAMGITARGAWLSVRRHFLEMGVDVQKEPIRVVGCGDMSGDVFGNGMLLSRAIRLVAAFDHRHIFIDPDPDPEASWAERKRLFDLPHSSWEDYDKSLISKGGGVFPRTLKSIPLTAAVREALGIEAEALDPDSLISAILTSPVDLLWFGGIGTFIKASAESHAAVGDPVNDALRVNACDVRARVIGEGANLGVTQAARIEFALKGHDGQGGRINADFIDNSAGVDSSDHEVNIKIALAAARRAGKLSEKRRIELLREMTDEVARLVLEDNRLQALALSIAESSGEAAMPAHVRLIEILEESGNLDRRTEGLADGETLMRRAQDGRGLTRPELAVLLSSAKLMLQHAIERSELPDDPGLEAMLLNAFPQPMQRAFPQFIKGHRLAREIIATKLANRMMNRLGIVLPFELAEEEGADLAQVAAAFALADRLFDLEALWQRLETAPMAEKARLALFARTATAVRGHMADLLRAGVREEMPSALAARIGKHVEALKVDTQSLLGERILAYSQKLRASLLEQGAPEEEASRVIHLFDMDGAVGIAELAAATGIDPRRLVGAFSRIGWGLGLDWAQSSAAMMNPSDPWERLLVAGLARDFQQMRLEFLRSIAQSTAGRADPVAAAQEWGQRHTRSIAAFRAMVARAEKSMQITPVMLAQIASQARNLLGRQ